MIRPRALKRGDRIAVLTPAGPAKETGIIRSAVCAIESLGFSVVLSPWIADSWKYLAGPDTTRIKELHWAYSEQAIDGIICLRGGYGSLRILPYLDWTLLRRHPKVFIGMSDITALQLAILQNADMITFAGPMPALNDFGDFTPFSSSLLLDSVTGTGIFPLVVGEGPEDPKPIILSNGEASGVLRGGNLNTIVSMIGTPFQPFFDGSIIVLEEINEAPYRVDRMITQLILGGHLDNVMGVALSRFHGCYEDSEGEIIDVLHERLTTLEVPILYGLALGHQRDVVTWPQGASGFLDCTGGCLHIREPGVDIEASS